MRNPFESVSPAEDLPNEEGFVANGDLINRLEGENQESRYEGENKEPRHEEENFERSETTKPFNLQFYVTDHSPNSADTGSPENLRELYADVKRDGVTSVRYDWRWDRVETGEGEFDGELLGRYGQAIEVMKEVGLESPTVIFSNIPKWALELYKQDKEKFFDEYRKYVEKVKDGLIQAREKTGETISRFQVLNELNNTVYTPIDAEDIPKLCDITRETLNDYNPNIKLLGTIFAGNLPGVFEKATLGIVSLGVPALEYLEKNKESLASFDAIAVDYYPGMWHIPLGEARENGKEIFKQLGLLKEVMEVIASWDKEYEIGEVGIQTNIPLMGEEHNQDRQRYFFDVFFREFKHLLLEFQRDGIKLPTRVGLYEAKDEPIRDIMGKILSKVTPFPENDMGMRKRDLSRKEILEGNRHTEEGKDRGPSQLSRIIKYMNTPVKKEAE